MDKKIDRLVADLGNENEDTRETAERELSELGEAPLEPLIKALRTPPFGSEWGDDVGVSDFSSVYMNGDEYVRLVSANLLGNIGGRRAVDALIEALDVIIDVEFTREYRLWCPGHLSGVFCAIVEALGRIGDDRAIVPLLEALWDVDDHIAQSFAIPVVRALIEIGLDEDTHPDEYAKAGILLYFALHVDFHPYRPIDIRSEAAELICDIGCYPLKVNGGYLVTVLKGYEWWHTADRIDLLSRIIEDAGQKQWNGGTYDYVDYRISAAKALEEMTEANVDGKEKENILKFLKSDDQGVVRMGISMLKGLLKDQDSLEYKTPDLDYQL